MTDTNTINDVMAELARARGKFGKFNNAHEGYAVILEEVEELWADVRTNPQKAYPEAIDPQQRHRTKMRAEAIQIAAMAVRFAEDVCQ